MTAPAGTLVPFNDLSRGLRTDRDLLVTLMADVADSGWLVHGPQHRAFETALAEYVGTAHALGVASGTDALEIALRAVLTAERPVVVTAANCGGYTTTAARRGGFPVRYADVDEDTHLLTAATVAPALGPDVGAVVVTHLYGRAADVAAIRALCAPLGIKVVEDCAQALGARTAQGRVGSLADVATFSFYPTKNLGAVGDGGAVTTGDDETAAVVRELRQYGWREKYRIERDGGRNSRLDELQAAVLLARLPRLDAGNVRRRQIIAAYGQRSSARLRVLPARDESHAGHLAVVVTSDRAALRDHLTAAGVRTDVHYPVPDHLQPAFSAEHTAVSLPVTERLARTVLSLPLFPELRDDEVEQVCEALERF